MNTDLTLAEIQRMKDEAHKDMGETLDEFRNDFPRVVEAAAATVGSTLGGAASFTALYLGGVVGLSAAGMTSGLAAAGAVLGGGMAVGMGVLAAPVAVFGVIGYAIAKRRRNAKLAAAPPDGLRIEARDSENLFVPALAETSGLQRGIPATLLFV